MENVPLTIEPAPRQGLITLTHVLYGLHGFSAVMGMLGPMLIVTAFLTGWPSIIAVIINYVKRSDVRGTWLESHFSWQIRTFWWAVLWVLIAGLLFITLIGIPFAWVLVIVVGIWVLYRIIRGWLALSKGEPMPMD
ncbi:MAG TPA: hypothetical protein VMN03_09245 [Burkholderiales bacterium]|nr:hypothetical protein [Burkholderiales bacterium]